MPTRKKQAMAADKQHAYILDGLELAVQRTEDGGHVHSLAALVLQADDDDGKLANGEHCSGK
jgi:hypothetical protein